MDEPNWAGFEYPAGVESLLVSLANVKATVNPLVRLQSGNVCNLNADDELPAFRSLEAAESNVNRALSDVAMLPESTLERLSASAVDVINGLLQDLIPSQCSAMIRASEPRSALHYLHRHGGDLAANVAKFNVEYDSFRKRLQRTGRPIAEGSEANDSLPQVDQEGPANELTNEEKAIGMLAKDMSIKKVEIAKRIGISTRSLGRDRMPTFDKAWKSAKAPKGKAGFVNADGSCDGIHHDEEPEF
jgi:hypothetical protein